MIYPSFSTALPGRTALQIGAFVASHPASAYVVRRYTEALLQETGLSSIISVDDDPLDWREFVTRF